MRARLASDCETPRIDPWSSAAENREMSDTSDGLLNPMPIDMMASVGRSVTSEWSSGRRPRPTATSPSAIGTIRFSPIHRTVRPTSPPWTITSTVPMKANTYPIVAALNWKRCSANSAKMASKFENAATTMK